MVEITPELVLRAYAAGVFPMSEARDDPRLFWVDPERRGIIPLDGFRVPRRLARTVRSDQFHVTADLAFEEVIHACAEPRDAHDGTWINDQIIALFTALHARGFAHSIETHREERLVGGLYGVALGGAFFGESMFSRESDASKVALVHLVARLKFGGYSLLDTQFVTEHLRQFGTEEVSRRRYHALLKKALAAPGEFHRAGESLSGSAALQSITQTS